MWLVSSTFEQAAGDARTFLPFHWEGRRDSDGEGSLKVYAQADAI